MDTNPSTNSLPGDWLADHEVEQHTHGALTKRKLAIARWKRLGPPCYKIGRRILYKRSEVDAWLNDHAVHPE